MVAMAELLTCVLLTVEIIDKEVRLLQLIQRETALKFSQILLWSDSQLVFGWVVSKKKRNGFVFSALQEMHKISSSWQWHRIPNYLNTTDRGLAVFR